MERGPRREDDKRGEHRKRGAGVSGEFEREMLVLGGGGGVSSKVSSSDGDGKGRKKEGRERGMWFLFGLYFILCLEFKMMFTNLKRLLKKTRILAAAIAEHNTWTYYVYPYKI